MSKSTKELSDEMQQCASILKHLQSRRDCVPFLIPVDWKALELPDYPEIVKNPMDLETIEKKLYGGKYANAEKFAEDVRLVWDNAKLYNPHNSIVYKAAEGLSKIFEKRYQKQPKKRKRGADKDLSGQNRMKLITDLSKMDSKRRKPHIPEKPDRRRVKATCGRNSPALKKGKTVIGFFTHKGGVSKTTTCFLMSQASRIKSKTKLIIDGDAQSNIMHCFVPPCIEKRLNCLSLPQLSQPEYKLPTKYDADGYEVGFNAMGERNLFQPNEFTSIIKGGAFKESILAQFSSEDREGAMNENSMKFLKKVKAFIDLYDITFIDMNPSFSILNKLLLSLCTHICCLLTKDVFSLGSLESFHEFRKERGHKYLVYLINSRISYKKVRNKQMIAPKKSDQPFVDQLYSYLKEKRIDKEQYSYIKYGGTLSEAAELAKYVPIKWLKEKLADKAITGLKRDINDLLGLILGGEECKILVPKSKFEWKKAFSEDAKLESSKDFESLSANQFGEQFKKLEDIKPPAFYIVESFNQSGRRYKCGKVERQNVGARVKQLKGHANGYDKHLIVRRAYRTNDTNIPHNLEQAIHPFLNEGGEYFGCMYFEQIVKHFDDIKFVELLMLENIKSMEQYNK